MERPGTIVPLCLKFLLQCAFKIFIGTAYIHESWTGNVFDGYDIALIKLDREFTVRHPTIDVPRTQIGLGQSVYMLGWRARDQKVAANLEMTILHYVPQDTCNNTWDDLLPWDIVLCAGQQRADLCLGKPAQHSFTCSSQICDL